MREVTQCFPVPYLLRTPAPWITPQTSSRYASPLPGHSSCWDWLYLLDTPVWIIKMSNIIELNYILFLTGEEDKRISVNTFLKKSNFIMFILFQGLHGDTYWQDQFTVNWFQQYELLCKLPMKKHINTLNNSDLSNKTVNTLFGT